MNIRIKVIFHYVSAWQLSFQPDVIRDGCGSLPLWELSVHRTSHAWLMVFLIKKLKYYKNVNYKNVNVNYKNISHYILFVFIILTSSIKNIRPLCLKHWLYSYLYSRYKNLCIILISVHSLPTKELLIFIKLAINSN